MKRSTSLAILTAALLLGACSTEQAPAPVADAPPPSPTPEPPVAQDASTAPLPGHAPPQATQPEGALPLVPGVYVMMGTDCTAPANAGLRFYDGVGISGTATHDCQANVTSRTGTTYVVDQSCIDAPAGDAPRTSEAQTVVVHDARSFTVTTADEQSRFSRCDDETIPEYLRERAGL